jgi:hypothetical protein
MKDILIIAGFALGVFVAGCIYALIRVLMDGRKQRRKMHERRVEDAEREEMFKAVDWERRYAELVETVAQRTGQMKEKA